MGFMKYFLEFQEMEVQKLETIQLHKELISLKRPADNHKFGLDLTGLEHGVMLGLLMTFASSNSQLTI